MLRTLLIGAALLVASGSAMADHGYVSGRVVLVEPDFSISIGGGRYNDGFRILYETGGQRYWTHSYYRPRDVIYVPRPVYVEPAYYERSYYRGPGWWRDGWRDRRDDRWDYRDHDRGRGHHRDHDRH